MEKDEIKVTDEMIEAGVRELIRSGAVDDYQETDRETVSEIFHAMLAVFQR